MEFSNVFQFSSVWNGKIWVNCEEKKRPSGMFGLNALCKQEMSRKRQNGSELGLKVSLFFRHFLPLCTKCQTNDYNLFQAMIDQILLNALTKHPKTKWAMSESELLWHIWNICDHMAQTSYFVIWHNMITENGDNH